MWYFNLLFKKPGKKRRGERKQGISEKKKKSLEEARPSFIWKKIHERESADSTVDSFHGKCDNVKRK